MIRTRILLCMLPVLVVACQPKADRDTIAKLRYMHVDIKEETIVGGLEKAMAGYQRFLRETPDSALTPEAIRRLADLKIQREYGLVTDSEPAAGQSSSSPPLPSPERVVHPAAGSADVSADQRVASGQEQSESQANFEQRAAQVAGTAAETGALKDGADDLERAGTLEAIELYQKLLDEHPLYERNDQVLYQMSRAYEELGRTEEAMTVMNRLARDFPNSRYVDEVQFRRAEYFFTHKRYLDAEDAYSSIVNLGAGSSFFDLALYKLGWTFYKQELYEDAVDRFIALLDYKVSIGYDFAQAEDEPERKRIEDTFRIISLSLSHLGGADAAADYFARHGKRGYEDSVYGNLGEFYFDKRRYADAAATYNAFVSRNPFHQISPRFHMRVIEIYIAGAFPSLVIDAKKEFARTYALQAEYWQHFEPGQRPQVMGFLKTNLTDLANHYHALYQNPKHAEEKGANFAEALHWYREFLTSFPNAVESPPLHYQLADLLLENRSFAEAAVEYEKTAYDYPRHEKSAAAGYAAIYAYREHLRLLAPASQEAVKREVVRSSLRFADTFPEHEKAAIILGAAADDLYGMKEFDQALTAAQKLIEVFPGSEADVLRAAWLVVAHSSYELLRYQEAEAAYSNVLSLLPPGDKTRNALVDNLAAAIYKQGEQANALEEYRTAADHFLRVGRMAPSSKIRVTAEYDAAAALMQLEDWKMAAAVLTEFRNLFPGHPLQPEVTKKMAYVYRKDGRLALAAAEYERIETESPDEEVRREALLIAAELYEKSADTARTLEVYRRYVDYFPQPVELNLETRNKIAEILKAENDHGNYFKQLRKIVAMDASAGNARTARTRYLAAKAALVLAELTYHRFAEVTLAKPFEANLRKKRDLMKAATHEFNQLLDYEVGEVTAAATFYLAEIYAHFSTSLMASERPTGLSALELEQYELAIEEQAYPFEEKAIAVHEKNLQLIPVGIYNPWIEKSLEKLAEFVPARYARAEEVSGTVDSLDTYVFAIDRPAPIAPPVYAGKEAIAGAEPASSIPSAEPGRIEEKGSVEEPPQSEESKPMEVPVLPEAAGAALGGGDREIPPEAAVQ